MIYKLKQTNINKLDNSFIDKEIVTNEFKNNPFANFLLKKLIEIVDKDITLEVREDNEPAIRLYLKNNFNKTAIRKGYYKGIDGILMERKRDSI